MYGIEIVTPAVAPIAAAALRTRLRLNDPGEDAELEELLASAAEQFEEEARRPVLATTYRQNLSCWPCGPIVLGRGGVTAVTAVGWYDADGERHDLDADQWRAELLTPPARVSLLVPPDAVTTEAGIEVATVGYVEFTAGWADAGSVPRRVRTAIMLLAGHWYANREAYHEGTLNELPQGWRAVIDQYRLGLSGDLGQ